MSVCAVSYGASPAVASPSTKTAPSFRHTETDHMRKDGSKGPLQIIISVDQQKLHLYSDGVHVADAPVATGVPDHPTPLGIFSIIQKSRDHRSNIYSNAPMPFMERITWSGVALHEGFNLGHPASHGCIRMSHEFATRLWALTKLGVGVVIARPELRPEEISDPHLFVHNEKPPDAEPPTSLAPTAPIPTAPTVAKLLKTAETVEADQTTDASRQHDPNAAVVTPAVEAVGPASDADEASPPIDPVAPDEAEAAAESDPEIPLPPAKPAEIAHPVKGPIAIFVSRKKQRIYVRQDFAPLFDAPISIEHPDQPLGTHVFTAMNYAADGASFRWDVISLPGKQAQARQPDHLQRNGRYMIAKRETVRNREPVVEAPTEMARQALARVEIPQDALDLISELMVPGSSLIISDQGLSEETGDGTNFIVVTP
ncbi:MAG: L,D-transpeptidase [Xanthobacteraceae bacterium]